MGDHDVTYKGRFVPDRILLTELVDQRTFLLVEEDGLAVAAHQFALALAPEIRAETVFLGFLLPGHTYYIVSDYSIGSPSALHQVALRSE